MDYYSGVIILENKMYLLIYNGTEIFLDGKLQLPYGKVVNENIWLQGKRSTCGY